MNTLSLASYKSLGTAVLTKSMGISLTLSLLAHMTAFGFTYNWAVRPPETGDQPIFVELIEPPTTLEKDQQVEGKDPDRKYVKKASDYKQKVHHNDDHTVSSLVAESALTPVVSAFEMHETTTSLGEAEAMVSLDSQELKYVSYLSKIKKKIEPQWHYPESAQKVGLQGRLALCFSIAKDGDLVRLTLLNSSGHSLLDKEALTAVRNAAPYFPLPERLNLSRLNILATFEYRMSPYSMSAYSHSPREYHR